MPLAADPCASSVTQRPLVFRSILHKRIMPAVLCLLDCDRFQHQAHSKIRFKRFGCVQVRSRGVTNHA